MFSSGDDVEKLDEYSWHYPYASASPQPVGHKLPNAFGFYDMHGNVWEWCHDRYGEHYYEASPDSDPLGWSPGTQRVDRGGCWFMTASMARSSARQPRLPTARSQTVGFRIARAVAASAGK
jgi:formylglycine-generating enzyme required for sulfatase activity